MQSPYKQYPTFNILLIILLCRILPIQAQTISDGVEKLAEGFQFVEGPVWVDGVLLFSDIPANTVYRWSEATGTEVNLQPSGNSNGLALDHNGNLLLAQHGKRRIAHLDSAGNETALVTHYNGKKLNSPNDIAIKSDGSIFFTDPPYGLDGAPGELDFQGIYRLAPNGTLYLLDKSLDRPNGITFSPDENLLYVGNAEARQIFVWDVVDDTTISNKRLFASISAWGSIDGMKTDAEGHLFATSPFGVNIYTPDGTPVDTIYVPGQTSNCNWGDADGNTLYITSGDAIYRVRNIWTGIDSRERGVNMPKSYKLENNTPNPFNGSTRIGFSTAKPGRYDIDIVNTLGQEVASLTDRFYPSGEHNLVWNAAQESSGIYFIRLASTEGVVMKKCMYIK